MYFSGWYLYGERSIRTHSTKRRSEQSWIQEKTHCFPPAMNSCFWCFTFNKFFFDGVCHRFRLYIHTDGWFVSIIVFRSINIGFCQFESNEYQIELNDTICLPYYFIFSGCCEHLDTFFSLLLCSLSQNTCPALSQITFPFMFNICSYVKICCSFFPLESASFMQRLFSVCFRHVRI